MAIKRVECPGCRAMVDTTTRSLDNTGKRAETIIKEHNPMPHNVMKVNPNERCPGSKTVVPPSVANAA